MNILAIGAHPDDIEIFMYGILSLMEIEIASDFLRIIDLTLV